MKHRITGNVMQVVEILMTQGESVFTERGGMAWMDNGFEMTTNARGGIGAALGRALAGESLFLTTYVCRTDKAVITFASEFPGSIMAVPLAEGQSIIAQRDAFMVAESAMKLSVHFRRRLGAGLFGGEGFIMQKVEGPGTAFFEIGGEVIERELKPGQILKVDPGYVAMHDPSVDYDIEMVKGLGNLVFGGEGLFLAKLTGPGRVWLQTMPLVTLAAAVGRYMRPTSSGGGIVGNILGGNG
ncbi:MAG: TIGR00266 family protein [Phototrophicaceae bacterium]|jgi:uncharacterized protein (TIGR00266 family)